MRDIQISIGEIIEAVYAELIETYNDRELALVAAQAVGDELLARRTKPQRSSAAVAVPTIAFTFSTAKS